jgi:hypothetical protein
MLVVQPFPLKQTAELAFNFGPLGVGCPYERRIVKNCSHRREPSVAAVDRNEAR